MHNPHRDYRQTSTESILCPRKLQSKSKHRLRPFSSFRRCNSFPSLRRNSKSRQLGGACISDSRKPCPDNQSKRDRDLREVLQRYFWQRLSCERLRGCCCLRLSRKRLAPVCRLSICSWRQPYYVQARIASIKNKYLTMRAVRARTLL